MKNIIKILLLISTFSLLLLDSSLLKWITIIVTLFIVAGNKEIKYFIVPFSLILLNLILFNYNNYFLVLAVMTSSIGLLLSATYKETNNKNLKIPKLYYHDNKDKEIKNIEKYIAAENAKLFHTEDCLYGKKIKYSKKIYFKTISEAEKQGYKKHSCVNE